MPIRVRLEQVMLEQHWTLTNLAHRVGLTLANLSILKTNKGRAIRFSTLEALCRELKCQPGDLLEFTDSTPATESTSEPTATAAPRVSAPKNHGLPGDYY